MSVSMLLGKKLSMTQLWDTDGKIKPVTVIEAGPCQVVQVKTKDGKDGYDAIQLGYGELPARNGGKGDARANKAALGHFKRHGVDAKRVLREHRLEAGATAPEAGTVLKVDEVFKGVAKVDVIGTSKGRGFQGTVKRHNFTCGPKTHGSKNYREPGSTGANQSPGHVQKGKRMSGHMGSVQRTSRNLEVVKIEPEHNLIYVKGAVPGPNGGLVVIRKAVRSYAVAITIETKDVTGKAAGSVAMDEATFGGFVKNKLLHSATVMYHANLRQGTACTKTRAHVAGTTKKLYRQKGTGRARAGTRKSGTRVGGGVIHGPKPRDFSYHMPQKQRRAALRAALLASAKDGELNVVAGVDLAEPKTKSLIAFLNAIGLATGTVLVATDGIKRNVYLAGRNLPGVSVVPAAELNARMVLLNKHLVIDQAAFERLNQKPEVEKRVRKPKGSRKAKGDVKGAEG